MINKIMLKIFVEGYSFFKNSEKGQSLVEYGLILALIAVVAIGILGTMGGQIEAIFTKISGALKIS